MYLTEMIKALPTQSGRYLAPAAALSHVLKRQQHRPKIRHWLQGNKRSKVNREVFAKFPKGAFSACLLGPMLLSMGQRGSRASGQLDLTATGTSGLHPQNLLSLLQQRSVGREAWPPSSQGDLLFPFAHQTRQRAVTWSPECSW